MFYHVAVACDDNCTGILLDNIAVMSEELVAGTGHIAGGYIPPPWQELLHVDSNVSVYLEELELRARLRERMRSVPWNEYSKLVADVEAMLRNVSGYVTRVASCNNEFFYVESALYSFFVILQMNKLAKHADALKTGSGDLRNNVLTAKIELDKLRKDIEGIASLFRIIRTIGT